MGYRLKINSLQYSQWISNFLNIYILHNIDAMEVSSCPETNCRKSTAPTINRSTICDWLETAIRYTKSHKNQRKAWIDFRKSDWHE